MATTDLHRLFLQALLTQPSLPAKQAQELYQRCAKACRTVDKDTAERCPSDDELPRAWAAFRGMINQNLEPLGLEIREETDQVLGGKRVALINTIADPLAQIASPYSPKELAYLKLLIDAIVLAPNYAFSISTATARSIVGDLRNDGTAGELSAMQAEKVLERLVGVASGGWLVESRNGDFSRFLLSQRAIMELEDYLKQTYMTNPDAADEDELAEEDRPLLVCEECRNLVFVGKLCPECPTSRAVHSHCLARILIRPGAICPDDMCGQAWTYETPWREVGELAVRDGDEQIAKAKRRARNATALEEKRAAGGAAGEEDEESGSSPRKSGKRGRSPGSEGKSTRKGKRVAVAGMGAEDDEEVDDDDGPGSEEED